MKLLSARLIPINDISGAGSRWVATSDDAWFELQTDEPLSGQCLRLDWSAGLFDPVSRVVLRYVIGDQNDDIILGAASFGRGQWTGQMPAATSRVLLSPVHSAGEFGFRIDGLTRLSFAEMMASAFRRRPFNALLSLTARLRGWRQASESELRDVFLTTNLTDYDAWRRERLRPIEADIDGAPTAAEINQPYIFILPLAGPDPATVRAHADALGRQDRANWSLHVVMSSEHLTVTARDVGQNPRVRFIPADRVLADYLLSLPPQALLHVLHPEGTLSPLFTRVIGATAQRHSDAVLFYSDEDRRTADDTRCSPSFKGDFDPVLIRTLDYIGAAAVWRVGRLVPHIDAAARIGAARTALTEAAKRLTRADVVHIARVLVTLPSIGTPKALQSHHMTTAPTVTANKETFISVVIPTRDYLDVLKPCVESLFRHASWPFELIIVDNGSVEPETLAYFDELREKPRAHILRADQPFNFSDLCNRGAAIATTPHLLFLNNDTEFLSAGWEAQIAPYLDDPTIGAIGAKLLYRNRRVQHAGVIAGLHGRAGHFEIGIREDASGYFGRANHAHALLAVTGAALAVRRDVFDTIGGFDAEHLPVDLNDIDFCLRLIDRGFINLYLPQWMLFHHESATRGLVHESDRIYGRERRYFSKRWLSTIRNDPYFNPNLSLWTTSAALS